MTSTQAPQLFFTYWAACGFLNLAVIAHLLFVRTPRPRATRRDILLALACSPISWPAVLPDGLWLSTKRRPMPDPTTPLGQFQADLLRSARPPRWTYVAPFVLLAAWVALGVLSVVLPG
ncbi:MAG TPA: hypothetical protein VEA69_10275 [Tepidisphaeraceae bacterium]|nr:hypothetical protein [Tepidisphaeraceae bacterium]